MAAALAHARAGDEDALPMPLRYDEWDEAKEDVRIKGIRARVRPTFLICLLYRSNPREATLEA